MLHDFGIIYSQDVERTFTDFQKPENRQGVAVSPELLSRTQQHNVCWTIEGESTFPYKLSLIKSRPHILYYIGNIDLLSMPTLGIVGPRRHSDYATQILQRLFDLAPQYRFVTISGLAPGVDQLCHKMSLDNNVPTIAVLGGGLRFFLRSSDRHLIHEIVGKGGLVISEFKLDQTPQTYTFPQRNRIIAGLSDVVFLPEAGERSGSLITVDFALSMRKPVYGVPNTIFASTSTGVNQKIASGAIHAMTDIQQFLHKNFSPVISLLTPPKTVVTLNSTEQSLLAFLGERQRCSLQDLLSAGISSSQELISSLTLLEMKKCIYQECPGIYKIIV